MLALVTILGVLVIIACTIGLYIVVALMAKSYKRNIPLWLLLSVFMSPVLVLLILLAVGKKNRGEELE